MLWLFYAVLGMHLFGHQADFGGFTFRSIRESLLLLVRYPIIKAFSGFGMKVKERISVESYARDLTRSKFVVSPRGEGIASIGNHYKERTRIKWLAVVAPYSP